MKKNLLMGLALVAALAFHVNHLKAATRRHTKKPKHRKCPELTQPTKWKRLPLR